MEANALDPGGLVDRLRARCDPRGLHLGPESVRVRIAGPACRRVVAPEQTHSGCELERLEVQAVRDQHGGEGRSPRALDRGSDRLERGLARAGRGVVSRRGDEQAPREVAVEAVAVRIDRRVIRPIGCAGIDLGIRVVAIPVVGGVAVPVSVEGIDAGREENHERIRGRVAGHVPEPRSDDRPLHGLGDEPRRGSEGELPRSRGIGHLSRGRAGRAGHRKRAGADRPGIQIFVVPNADRRARVDGGRPVAGDGRDDRRGGGVGRG